MFQTFWGVAITSVFGLRNTLQIVSQYAIILVTWQLAHSNLEKNERCKNIAFSSFGNSMQNSSHKQPGSHLRPLANTCTSSRLQPLAVTGSHLHPLTCSQLQPLAATPLAATCTCKQPLATMCTSSHLQATCSQLQLQAATCSHLQPPAANGKRLQVAASGCFFDYQIAHLLRPQ